MPRRGLRGLRGHLCSCFPRLAWQADPPGKPLPLAEPWWAPNGVTGNDLLASSSPRTCRPRTVYLSFWAGQRLPPAAVAASSRATIAMADEKKEEKGVKKGSKTTRISGNVAFRPFASGAGSSGRGVAGVEGGEDGARKSAAAGRSAVPSSVPSSPGRWARLEAGQPGLGRAGPGWGWVSRGGAGAVDGKCRRSPPSSPAVNPPMRETKPTSRRRLLRRSAAAWSGEPPGGPPVPRRGGAFVLPTPPGGPGCRCCRRVLRRVRRAGDGVSDNGGTVARTPLIFQDRDDTFV